jgi:hypothetical protein
MAFDQSKRSSTQGAISSIVFRLWDRRLMTSAAKSLRKMFRSSPRSYWQELDFPGEASPPTYAL